MNLNIKWDKKNITKSCIKYKAKHSKKNPDQLKKQPKWQFYIQTNKQTEKKNSTFKLINKQKDGIWNETWRLIDRLIDST